MPEMPRSLSPTIAIIHFHLHTNHYLTHSPSQTSKNLRPLRHHVGLSRVDSTYSGHTHCRNAPPTQDSHPFPPLAQYYLSTHSYISNFAEFFDRLDIMLDLSRADRSSRTDRLVATLVDSVCFATCRVPLLDSLLYATDLAS